MTSILLREYTMLSQRINVVVVRDNQLIIIEVELGSRPPS